MELLHDMSKSGSDAHGQVPMKQNYHSIYAGITALSHNHGVGSLMQGRQHPGRKHA